MNHQPITDQSQFNERQIKRIFYRRLGTVVWVSFLAAAVQTMIFFAQFDPAYLNEIASITISIGRWQGYALGFVFFWTFTFIAGLFCGVVMALPRTKLAQRIRHES
jgi:capsular polysaccharide biosynthesis protein